MAKGYLTHTDLKGHSNLKPKVVTIKRVEKEIVDGRPRIVLYFEGEPKGLVLTRQSYDDVRGFLGPHPLIDDFFASPEGQEH